MRDIAENKKELINECDDKIQVAARKIKRIDPNALRGVVRARLARVFDDATRDLASGPAQFGAAKLRAQIAGHTEQGRVLDILLKETGGSAAAKGFRDMLNVFQTQGFRKQQGSATSFNTQLPEELAESGAATTLKAVAGAISNPLTPFGRATDMFKERHGVDYFGLVASGSWCC